MARKHSVKTESLQHTDLLKKRPRDRCFPVDFATFLRNPLRMEKASKLTKLKYQQKNIKHRD